MDSNRPMESSRDVEPDTDPAVPDQRLSPTASPLEAEVPCSGTCYLQLASLENRLYMVNFGDPSKCIPYPAEFSRLVPNIGKLGAEDVERLLRQAGYTDCPEKFKPVGALAEGGTWFFMLSEPGIIVGGRSRHFVVLKFNRNPPSVTRVSDRSNKSYCTFMPSFKAFV
ncbi:hypothetical protein R1flu_015896 [Riccia fluitans]|uniref:Uncharacterized protein n=1 Tax=Riccia fluitans TaxID=41844 RepID=A0ABD1YL40_9MARC